MLLNEYFLKTVNWNGQDLGYDLLMINDRGRNQFFNAGLTDVKDKVVLDIGAGTGLLSAMAVAQGAKKVFAFERDIRKCELARRFIEKSNLSDKIQVICSDILHADKHSWPHDKIDVIISETFANDCFIENFAFLVDHVENNFNLSDDHRWIPDMIRLKLTLVDVPGSQEFDPGVAVPEGFKNQIEDAVSIYRDSFYHHNDELIMPVAYLPPKKSTVEQHDSCIVDQYLINKFLKNQVDCAKYHINFDYSKLENPYIKINWILETNNIQFDMNQAVSWKSIAFKVDKTKSNNFYFRFNLQSHALIGSQKSN